jgi:hypothetical protein
MKFNSAIHSKFKIVACPQLESGTELGSSTKYKGKVPGLVPGDAIVRIFGLCCGIIVASYYY